MKMVIPILGLALFGVAIAAAFNLGGQKPEVDMPPPSTPAPAGAKSVVVAGGCFWCLEPLFRMVNGVTDVEVGYAGGDHKGVSYEEVCSGDTGHAEAVKITFDPKKVSEHDLLQLFFTLHDPTTKDAQGPDHGTQYRSAIFYADDAEKALAHQVIDEITRARIWDAPIVTTVEPLKNYTRAEEYHQNYYAKFEHASMTQKMQMNAGYCTAIIEPKVRKFKEKLQHLMKQHDPSG